MLAAPFNEETSVKPGSAPGPFKTKEAPNYGTSNRFSDHDNRNSFQYHGVYLGNGRDTRLLGKHLIPINMRLHHTEPDFIKHYSLKPVDRNFDSLYHDSFEGKPTPFPPVHRRFPKTYKEPAEGPIKLDTTTTDRFRSPDVPYKTPLHVLALSQEPFPKHNRWKYSYQPLNRVYPQYDTTTKPLVDNIFNRYGADFMTQGEMNNSFIY
ncbi:uncharacterized protein LOC121384374 [Gigantopelta aegis]|uniref:uncharacterized protein LOC121384374 n=1 Tax=Gigantopelta aegis TaxID=1735272 RepID=UPI001B8873A0|nr:uncharacterized protein LOC121384374 [Gigantopelta aegis]